MTAPFYEFMTTDSAESWQLIIQHDARGEDGGGYDWGDLTWGWRSYFAAIGDQSRKGRRERRCIVCANDGSGAFLGRCEDHLAIGL